MKNPQKHLLAGAMVTRSSGRLVLCTPSLAIGSASAGRCVVDSKVSAAVWQPNAGSPNASSRFGLAKRPHDRPRSFPRLQANDRARTCRCTAQEFARMPGGRDRNDPETSVGFHKHRSQLHKGPRLPTHVPRRNCPRLVVLAPLAQTGFANRQGISFRQQVGTRLRVQSPSQPTKNRSHHEAVP
jgi:hypothetical protein